jgi:hypothetical protein
VWRIIDRGIEGLDSVLRAEEGEDPVRRHALRSTTVSEWYQSKKLSLLSVAEKKKIH